MKKQNNHLDRRVFLKSSAMALAAGLSGRAFAAGSDTLRVGVIGCGGRGTGAAIDCVKANKGIHIVAMGDLFKDRLDSSLSKLTTEVPDHVFVDEACRFVGFDAYTKVIACDVDMVILAAPPGFRPMHLQAAVAAGKHVFMEKPVAVDPVGVRSVITSSELAREKGLAIVAGTQRRHQNHYLELMKRIHHGDLGELLGGSCYWNMGDLWVVQKQPEWSDMEWQCRNWLYFTWLSGDHIVEQHVHNLDVMNWALGLHPVSCMGMGGRQVRTDPVYGNIFDHFAVEYEYPNGVKVTSMCRQTKGCHERVSEEIAGTKGRAYLDGSTGNLKGQNAYAYQGENPNPYEQEHADLVKSIRNGKPLNEGRRVAESTLTAIMGRMSAYTGRALNWDWVMEASKLDLSPAKYEMTDLAVRPVAVPGKTALV